MSKKILTLIAIIASINAIAQSDTLQGKKLDEVVVTANKTEQKESQTGKVITVINKQQIEKSSAKSVAELLNEQAGVVVNGALNNAGSVQTVYMRGANVGRTLILMDGIPMNDPSGITGDYDLNMFAITDVERIEICKGAQSTLYGSDAVAGVINIITIKKDITKPFNVKATAVGGNLGTFKGNIQLYGKADKLTYTARYSRLQTKGFSSAYDSAGNKGFDNDGYNGNVVNAAVQFQATKNLLFKAFTMYGQYKADIDASAFADDKYYYINNNSFTTGTGFQFKNDAVTLVGNYQFMQLNRTYQRDSLDKAVSVFYLDNKYFAKTQFAELYASIKLGSGFSLLQGADFRYASMNNQYKSVSGFGPYNSGFADTSMSQGSMYASLQFNSKKFNVELGGRLNVHSKYGSNYTYTFNPSYSFNDHYRIFGSIASGFKAPSLYQLYAGGGTGNPNLLPEKSLNYEIGIQQQYKMITNRLVLFYRNIDNGIDYSYTTFSYFNFAKQKVKGIEYEITLKPTQQLNITANYTFIAGNEATQSRVNFKDTSYDYFLRRPKNNINLTVGYQFNTALFVSISGKYVSDRYDVGGYKKADISLSSYFLLNAYAEYKLKDHFKFFADAQNITNKKFFDINGFNAIPFLFNAGLTFNW